MEQQNIYGRPKPETALSSAELNRIVTQSDDTGEIASHADLDILLLIASN